MVVVLLLDPFREIGARRNSAEARQSAHAPRSGPEIIDRRSSAEDGAPEGLRGEQSKSRLINYLQFMPVGRRRSKMNSSVLRVSYIDKRTKESCDRDSEVWTVHSGRDGVLLRKPRKSGKRYICRQRDFDSRWSKRVCLVCSNWRRRMLLR